MRTLHTGEIRGALRLEGIRIVMVTGTVPPQRGRAHT